MKPNIVVDIGNSRIKWGHCAEDGICEVASLPPENEESWYQQINSWKLKQPIQWAIAGVHPERVDRFMKWVKERPDKVALVHDRALLPIKIDVSEPGRVGIDRLLNGVAGRSRARPGVPLCIVDAGSAITVDWVDKEGVFRGGAIFPGLQLMAKSLQENTAALPFVEMQTNRSTWPAMPGNSTELAIRSGVFWAAAGGIDALTHWLVIRADTLLKSESYITGGDASYLRPVLEHDFKLWPTMTLEGIRLAAEALP
jgi:type III pantothenate kinase